MGGTGMYLCLTIGIQMSEFYPWCEELMTAIIADKEKRRRESARKPWPEKVAISERLREAGKLARAGMARTLEKQKANLGSKDQ